MHIMEGYLPLAHAVGWSLASAPFLIHGLRSIRKAVAEKPETKLLLGLSGAFTFVLSSLKLPSVTGSSSHASGVGLGAILFGPAVMVVPGSIVLLFQALLLAHGGLTTLGANAFSMAIVGPWVSYGVYRLARWSRAPQAVATFLAATLGNLATYVTTSIQLALAFPDPAGGLFGALLKFMGIFAITQVPLAITEGLLTVLVLNLLRSHSQKELQALSHFSQELP